MNHRKVIVIGGGAAGMMAALFAARAGAQVTLLERNAADLGNISGMIDRGMTSREIMDVALRDIPYDIFDELEVDYRCTCSKEKMDAVIRSLGRRQVNELLAEQVAEGKREELEINCRFCGEHYVYGKEELAGMDYAKE